MAKESITTTPAVQQPEVHGAVNDDTKKALDSSASTTDSDGFGSTDDHIFADPVVAEHWRKIYDEAKYESRHRFDPTYTWTAAEEKKLVRKVRLLKIQAIIIAQLSILTINHSSIGEL